VAGDHGVSCFRLGVARLVRTFGLGVLGVAILLEGLVLDDLFHGDFFCVKPVFSVGSSSNSAEKLVEVASAFAGAVDIGVVADNLGLVGPET